MMRRNIRFPRRQPWTPTVYKRRYSQHYVPKFIEQIAIDVISPQEPEKVEPTTPEAIFFEQVPEEDQETPMIVDENEPELFRSPEPAELNYPSPNPEWANLPEEVILKYLGPLFNISAHAKSFRLVCKRFSLARLPQSFMTDKKVEDIYKDPKKIQIARKLVLHQIELRKLRKLAGMLKASPTVLDLALRDERLNSDKISIYSELLASNKAVSSLDLVGSQTATVALDAAMLPVSTAIQSSSTLLEFSLTNFNLRGHWGPFWTLCFDSASLTRVTLSSTVLEHEDFLSISEALKNNTSIEILCLERCALGDVGLTFLTNGLLVNKRVKVLNISHNRFTADASIQLARLIQGNDRIEYLNLSNNFILDKGLATLSQAISETNSSSQLRILNLQSNLICDDGIIELCKALRSHRSLQTLLVDRNHLGDPAADALVDLMEFNHNIEHIGCTQHKINATAYRLMEKTHLRARTRMIIFPMSYSNFESN